MNFEIGDRVRSRWEMAREIHDELVNNQRRAIYRWVPHAIKMIEGIYIGYRYKQTGYKSWYDDGDFSYSVLTETEKRTKVGLIVTAAHKDPVIVDFPTIELVFPALYPRFSNKEAVRATGQGCPKCGKEAWEHYICGPMTVCPEYE